jgi:tRNA G18 (ribose-2'-O)-methylase SpoU
MQFIHVTNFDDPRLNSYVNLTELQLRNRLEPEKGIFIAESMKVIARALTAGVEPESFLIQEEWVDEMGELFAQVDARFGENTPVYIGKSELLEQLTGYKLHRGAISAMHRWKLPTLEEMCANADAKRIAVFENIVDHTNLGAMIRSAAALDVDAFLVTPSCADPLYRRSVRVSMGTVFEIPWTRIGGERANHSDDVHTWPHPGVDELQNLGFTTVSMALNDDSISLDELVARLHSPADDAQHIEKLALIFGTEGDGLSHRTIAASDITCKIPMSHGVDSLNVAAASAVTFWATHQ